MEDDEGKCAMGQGERAILQNIEETQAVMVEKIEMIEGRVQETTEGTKATIDNVVDKVKGIEEAIENAKLTIDNLLETIKHSMEETIERVKYTATLIEQVDQNPWIMFGSAVLTGYVLGSLKSERSSSAKGSDDQPLPQQEQKAGYSLIRFNFDQSIPEDDRIRFLHDLRKAVQEVEAELERVASSGEGR
jgi:uncharacterized protein with von Willebrand factor type A (vWA) domain